MATWRPYTLLWGACVLATSVGCRNKSPSPTESRASDGPSATSAGSSVSALSASVPFPPTETPSGAEALDGIKRIDDTHYEVSRAVVQAAERNSAQWMRSGRIVPAVEEGKPVGIRLFGIRQNTFFAQLGLQNGDTLLSINDRPLLDAAAASDAYAKLKSQDAFTLVVSRRGEKLELHYAVK